MRKNKMVALMLISILGLSTCYADEKNRFIGTIAVSKKDKKKYPDLAKVSFQQALDIVSKKSTGKIVEIALEEERGYLVYEVELVTPEHTKTELYLDAGDGSVLYVKEKKDK